MLSLNHEINACFHSRWISGQFSLFCIFSENSCFILHRMLFTCLLLLWNSVLEKTGTPLGVSQRELVRTRHAEKQGLLESGYPSFSKDVFSPYQCYTEISPTHWNLGQCDCCKVPESHVNFSHNWPELLLDCSYVDQILSVKRPAGPKPVSS